MPKIPVALARSSRSNRVARRTALAAAAVLAVGAVVATVSVTQLAAAEQVAQPVLMKNIAGQSTRIGTLAEVLELRAAHAAEVAAVHAAQAAYLASPAGAQATAQSMAASQYGWGDDQFGCLVDLWNRESGWNLNAYNADSGAAGIPQALPGEKMAIIAPDWQTNPATQIAWGLGYIASAYGTPCAAWNHSEGYNWY